MNKLAGILLFAALIIGCTPTLSIKPIDAGIHTLYFEYWQDGKFHSVKGHASAIFDGGSERLIRVLIPKNAKGALLVTDDGDDLLNYVIDGEKWVEINLDEMPSNTNTNTVGLSMVTKNYGTMTGRLYLIGNLNINDPLKVDYRCPYKNDKGAVGSCSRPNGFNFFLTVKVIDDYAGKMRVVTNGVCENEQELYDLDGAGEIYIKINNFDIGYCNVRIDIRQQKEGDHWAIKKFKELNVNYFDSRYIFLGKPKITGRPGKWKIKANDHYKSYSLNGKRHRIGCFRRNKTIKSKNDKIMLIVWDEFGRTSYVRR